ncbi:general transcription factor IIF subunit 2-like isoform X2 [Simochromis diagramma]|uniref:general transcription factor IIF subunit 2-like isoform X2 n=1 Tax=Simochromis diagramma TaxID=43689 RepID=UPI001A7E8DCE|nr:general transcription factor IIF subunit 2-like isoform X2 [Simochromis diagramma]
MWRENNRKNELPGSQVFISAVGQSCRKGRSWKDCHWKEARQNRDQQERLVSNDIHTFILNQVCFSLSDELIALDAVGENDASLEVPKDHPFTMHPVGGQTMAVFSRSNTDEISLEGMVVHRAECRPVVTDNYMKLKKLQIKESIKPQRLSQQLERAVTTIFKPVANHDFNMEYEKKKKTEGKMVRAERQLVLDMLFSAFEKHQYYNIKALVDITKQPVTYLKEIMREIGTYNSKGVHKSTWELKPEYRHYQSDEEEMQTT